jgi:formate-dependent nitrite reductase membrane component NrfD
MQAHPERPGRRRWPLRVVGAALVGLLLCSCGAMALLPVLAGGGHETQTDHAFQVLFAALFALLGLLLLLTERQLRQIGWSRSPVSLARLLFTSRASFTFWVGVALFGVALARLEFPAQAGALNVGFWALAAFWLLGEVAITALFLLRPRRVRAPGRDAGGGEPGD